MTDLLHGSADSTQEVPDFPMERAPGCPFAPPPKAMELNASRQLSRVRIWDGSTPWLITGYDAIRSLFTDARASVDDRIPGYPHWNEGMLSTVHKRPRSVFTSDAEEHTRYRRMLSRPFTFKRVEALRPAVQRIADDHIDAILAGPQPADLVAGLALAVPTLVISEMLGVPYEDAEFFQEHANKGMNRYATAEDAAEGAGTLARYLKKLIHVKMDDPGENLVSDLAERVKSGEITDREAAQLATGVLIAGHETTAGQLGVSIVALLENPDQAALLRDADDPKVIAAAIEELMRYCSIIQTGQRRIATEDIDVDGVTIRAGEGIILDVAPANWDARQFPAPDRLDLTRDDGPQVGFGYGRHQCVGQQLARMELQIVLPTLLRRIPTLRLAVALEELPFKHDALAYGLYELPVSW
ncbi:cytochrome P450 [Mycolicibacterium madagascariense]|uniref:Steroid C26-monooxygenase n=1 Tax=Mycolicibacterium madagascariense TaxID=212765 RepID=A0A7I7XD22_9MYCO|nr:cytochrome P450 [Mycolicibacterium madagascariense]MCV7011849.1 cytochrome P450 [Mycolicibacterium madagascariense]BBZ26298.1 cytochrome P450 [Mycolicibacterium madagascariense]